MEELEEAWFLGLRLREGVQWSALQAEFQAAPEKDGVLAAHAIVEELCGLELVSNQGGAVRLTPRGVLFSNEVFARFLTWSPLQNCM